MPDKIRENLPPALATSRRPAGSPRWFVAAVGAYVAVVYLACVHGQWWPTSDSALYVGLGRSLAEGNGYQFNGAFCNYVTPGLPWLYMICHVLGGENSFWLAHLATTLCGLAGLWLIYVTLARLTNRTTALAVAVMTAGSQLFFYHANVFLTDVPFMPIFWGMLYVTVRYLQEPRAKYLAWAGALAVLSVVLRVPGLTVVGPLAAGALFQVGAAVRLPRRIRLAGAILLPACAAAVVFYLISILVVQETPPYINAMTKNRVMPQIVREPVAAVEGLAELIAWPLVSDGHRSIGWEFRAEIDRAKMMIGLWMIGLGCLGMIRMFLRRQILLPVTLLLSTAILLTLRGEIRDLPVRYMLPIGPIMSVAVIWGVLWLIQGIVFSCRKLLPVVVRLFRRSSQASAGYQFDINPSAITAPKSAPKAQPSPLPAGPYEFKLPRWTCLAVTLGLVGATLAGNADAMAERLRQHAFFGHTDSFLLHIGSGSFEGLSKMADAVRGLPPDSGPVISGYPDSRILHLLTRRVIACPAETEPLLRTAAALREFMDRVGSKYVVIGDEDVTANRDLANELVKAEDFHQVFHENNCYFFHRNAPVVAAEPATTQGGPTTTSSTRTAE